MKRSVPRTSCGSMPRPSLVAASMPVYSAAWMPAVTSTRGPSLLPRIAMYGQRYFASPASPSKVKLPLVRPGRSGISMGPMRMPGGYAGLAPDDRQDLERLADPLRRHGPRLCRRERAARGVERPARDEDLGLLRERAHARGLMDADAGVIETALQRV